LAPLAQATLSLTTDRPRSSALVPLGMACQDWAKAEGEDSREDSSAAMMSERAGMVAAWE
jgi:hypothetical protein